MDFTSIVPVLMSQLLQEWMPVEGKATILHTGARMVALAAATYLMRHVPRLVVRKLMFRFGRSRVQLRIMDTEEDFTPAMLWLREHIYKCDDLVISYDENDPVYWTDEPFLAEFCGHSMRCLFNRDIVPLSSTPFNSNRNRERTCITFSSTTMNVDDFEKFRKMLRAERVKNTPDPEMRVWSCMVDMWIAVSNWYHNKTWDNIIIKREQKQFLERNISSFLSGEEWYNSHGIAWTYGLLLSGPPGCGKTSLIKAISARWKLSICLLRMDNTMSGDMLRHALGKIPHGYMIVIEDVDCMTGVVRKRGPSKYDPDADEGFSQRSPRLTLSDLLQALDGVDEGRGRIVIITTNYPDHLDEALVRARRIDYHCRLTYCSVDELREFFSRFFDVIVSDDRLQALETKNVSAAQVVSTIMNNRPLDHGLPYTVRMEYAMKVVDVLMSGAE